MRRLDVQPTPQMGRHPAPQKHTIAQHSARQVHTFRPEANIRPCTSRQIYFVIRDAELEYKLRVTTATPQQSQRIVTGLLSFPSTTALLFPKDLAAGVRLMGMLMVRWPKTGLAISTGRHIESRLFSSTPVFFSSTYCPYCRVMHECLSKTHGVTIPACLNVNSWGERRRFMRRCEMTPPRPVAIHLGENDRKRWRWP
jgi:hypothetical protein